MSTKATTINGAYGQLRISGLTVNPSPSDLVLALNTLEQMMAEYYNSWNLNISYVFEEIPNLNTLTGVELCYQAMMELNLACRLIPPFNKEVPQALIVLASVSLSNAIGRVAQSNMRPIQASRRMPVGSGNTLRMPYNNRYTVPVPVPPVAPETNYILQGEQFDYYEDFSTFLGTATIASYEIVCDPLLTIVTSANADPRITYTIAAPTQPPSSFGPLQIVKITVTDSLGRVDIRLIYFGVTTPPAVPPP